LRAQYQSYTQRYVHVFFDGTVDASRSLGVTQANVGSSGGFYCFTGLGLVRGGQVSVDFNGALSNATAQFGVSSTAGCESLVVTFDPAGNPAPTGFFLTPLLGHIYLPMMAVFLPRFLTLTTS
jgi:hypothetical protein